MTLASTAPIVKLLITLLALMTFGLAAFGKWKDGSTPDWFKKQFENTFLAKLPGGLSVGYWMIALLETSVALLMIWSLGRGEFLNGPAPEILSLGLSGAMGTFLALGFGLRLSGDFQGAANLYSYFGVTLLGWAIIQKF